MRIDSLQVDDSLISYKGHGMVETASKTNSIAHVAAHENRHIAQFRNYARYHNKKIIREDISIRYEFIEGNIVAVAGQATTVMHDKPEENSIKQVKIPEGTFVDLKAVTIDENFKKEKELDILLTRIEAALNRIEARLEKTDDESMQQINGQADKAIQLRNKKIKLEEQKRKIEKMRNMISADKLKEMTEELLGGAVALIEQSAKLLNAIVGLKTGNQSEDIPDKYNEVSISDFSLMYTGILFDTTI